MSIVAHINVCASQPRSVINHNTKQCLLHKNAQEDELNGTLSALNTYILFIQRPPVKGWGVVWAKDRLLLRCGWWRRKAQFRCVWSMVTDPSAAAWEPHNCHKIGTTGRQTDILTCTSLAFLRADHMTKCTDNQLTPGGDLFLFAYLLRFCIHLMLVETEG